MHVPPVAQRDVVAAEDDQIGPLRHQHGDGPGDHLVRDGLTAVDVGQEAEPQTAQRLGQAGDGKPRSRELEIVAFVEKAVRRAARSAADRGRAKVLEKRSPRGHRPFYRSAI